MDVARAVPDFFLYAEPPRPAEAGFIHVESLSSRSRPAHWTIRPHAHRDLLQLFLLERGGGAMQADGRTHRFAAPCLIVVPAGTIHSFVWQNPSGGRVLTLAASSLPGRMAAPAAAAAAQPFATAAARPIADGGSVRRLDALLRQLAAESVSSAPAHEEAVAALLVLLGVEVLRITGAAGEGVARDAALLAQFRAVIEESFRERPTLPAHLKRLGVSERRLRRACRAVAASTPMRMMLDRTVLEARRMLVSSDRTAAAIAYELGFDDPAYFSRLFRAHTGQSVRAFRRTALG